MNRNEFYKQLMSEYSFDADKIKSNARKGRFARQRSIPMYIGMTAAAAVMVVAVGTTVFMAMDNNSAVDSGVVLSGGNDSMLTPSERMIKALEELEKNAESSEPRDVMVTFSEALSPAEAKSVLAAYAGDSIPVKKLYFADGTEASGETQVKEGFGGDRRIKGVIVNCAGYVMASLNGDSRVFLVENVSESDMNIIAPIDTDAVEDNIVSVPDDPVIPDIAVPSAESGEPGRNTHEPSVDSAETSDIETSDIVPGGESDETSAPVSAETSDVDSAETAESAEAPDNTQDNPATVPEPPQIDPPASSVTTPADTSEDPVEVQPEILPDGVTLPESIDKLSYETVNLGAKDAFFLNDRVFFVYTPGQIMLYSFDGKEERQIAYEDCLSAKVCWVSEDGSSLIVSGKDENNKRNRLLYIDAAGEQIIDLNAADTVMEGTLAGAGYNAESGLLAMNILENDRYYVCVSRLSGGQLEFLSDCFESDSAISLMAINGDKLYLAAADGSLTQIYEADVNGGGSRLIKTYENNPRISSNLAFTHGIIYPSSAALTGSVEIFDPQSGAFVRAGGTDTIVSFGKNRHSFSAGGSFYTVSGGTLMSDGGTAVTGGIEYRRSASRLYEAAASGGKVVITDSVYTDKAKSGALIFGDFSDSASADIRAAVNGAISVNNVIAQGTCEKYGITSPQTLSRCIDVYYSAGAADSLRSRCGISVLSGIMKYNGAGLTAINIPDTVLTVSISGDTASGMLYAEAGSFGGRTAYISYSVKLVRENGSWKLDGIIGG